MKKFDRLYDALPRIRPVFVQQNLSVLPRSFFNPFKFDKMLPAYNGFRPAERTREYQLQVWLQSAGVLPRPVGPCQLCGAEGRVEFHAENYYDIWQMHALCKSCHMLTHRRHTNPERWLTVTRMNRKTGDEWFNFAPREGEDFAAYLRNRFGAEYGLVERTSMSPLPKWIKDAGLPKGLLAHDFHENDYPAKTKPPQAQVLQPVATVLGVPKGPIRSILRPAPVAPAPTTSIIRVRTRPITSAIPRV